jgi:hypothetical protein
LEYDRSKINSIREQEMASKNFNRNRSFADLEMAGILEKTRTQGYLGEIDRVVDWTPIEELLQKDYPVGQSSLGNKAYQPLVLLKAALLQKWYGMDYDPELENQINDRLSFERIIGIPVQVDFPRTQADFLNFSPWPKP